ncbi:DNRLRE domain-containing protein [Streptomyces sp. NPDC047928]|uniref:DNRLRE domain-containing protein n=1 Tax=unclassified Streptomyces TaxID=2593676 RepID=UPI00371837C0
MTLLTPMWGEPDGAAEPGPAKVAGPLDENAAQKKARATGKRVEVTALRNETSTTYALPDGSFQLTAHGAPIRAKVGDTWKPIDTTLTRTGDGWAPRAAADPVVFHTGNQNKDRASRAVYRSVLNQLPADGTNTSFTDLVTFTSGGHQLTVGWHGTLPEPVIDGASALYKDVFPRVDLLLTARDSGFSHVLVVHDATAAANPALKNIAYRLTSPDLTFHHNPVTDVVSAKDSKGNEIAVSPTPYMWDSAGKMPTAGNGSVFTLPGLAGPQIGTHTAIGDADLTGGGTSTATMTITPDTDWLTGPDLTWPAFVDPSITGKTKNWTTVYAKYPSSSFYDGANYNSGTTEARVGYESTTGGLSRSYFRLGWTTAFKGATVTSASIRLLETYAWSCSAREMQIHHTGGISSATTWNNQPAKKSEIGRKSFAHGYSSSCPDAYVTYDAKSIAQSAATGGWTEFTIGLFATTETSSYSWKKFKAEGESAPKITISYNRPPNVPTGLTMTPGPDCDTNGGDGYASVGKSDLTFAAAASDADGNLANLDFEVWQSGSTTKLADSIRPVDSTGKASVAVSSAKFIDGKTYFWQVRAIDTSGAASDYAPVGTAVCGFRYDASAPNSPEVNCTPTAPAAFPPAGPHGEVWSTVEFGTAGLIEFCPNGTTDIKEYKYSFDTSFSKTALPNPNRENRSYPAVTPPHAGPSVLYVRTVDTAGQVSSPTKYLFNVKPRASADTAGDVTGDGVPDVYTIDPAGNLLLYAKTRGTDRLHFPMRAAYAEDADGRSGPVAAGYWTGALITHNGDWLPGDGIQDLVARMPDGKLYLYRGDGYGGFDVGKRHEMLLPPNSPAPSTFRQIMSVSDISGDGRPDLLALAGGTLWSFTGYTGASFSAVKQLSGDDWAPRTLVQADSIAGGAALDLVYRTDTTGRVFLRKGLKNANGIGTDPASFATQAASEGGIDVVYGSSGWSSTALPIVIGTPDVTGDSVPDVWVVRADGNASVYPGNSTGALSTTTMFNVISSTVGTSWTGHTALG